jgi:transposase
MQRPHTPSTSFIHEPFSTFSPSQRGRILEALTHSTQQEVAAQFNISQSVVSRLLKHYKLTGSLYPKRSSGRPPLYSSERDRRALRRHAEAEPFATLCEINEGNPVTASTRSTRRALSAISLGKQPALRRLDLSP